LALLDAEAKRLRADLEAEVNWRREGHQPRMTERDFALKEGRLNGIRRARHILLIGRRD